MMIDTATIKSLELLQNCHDSKSKECLFGHLNGTLTVMGERLLKSNILQPLTDIDILNKRYDAIQELSTNEDMFTNLRSILKGFPDADKYLTSLILVPKQHDTFTTASTINNILALKQFITSGNNLYKTLNGCKSILLKDICTSCDPSTLDLVKDLIDEKINKDIIYTKKPIELRNQRLYAVKVGIHHLLDVARKTFAECNEDAYNHVQELKDNYGIMLELKYDERRKYYISLPISELEDRDLPEVFINIFRNKKNIECQTMDLIKHNQKIHDSYTEIILMSDEQIQSLTESIKEYIPILFKISESISLLDMITSLVNIIIMNEDYIRPEYNTGTLAIKEGRHPIKEKSMKFIPNDIYSTESRRFQIITGCNMSGKSTYIRSVAMICIMGQIGSFIPAKQATLPVIKQLLARISTDSVIEANVSTFSSEMREISYILDNINDNSLVIIDELCRGTSIIDGQAIALAISEELIKSKALVWFVTHFRNLSTILSERYGVMSMHMSVDINHENILAMLYRVSEGVDTNEHYGLKLAKIVSFPDQVYERAEYVINILEDKAKRNERVSPFIVLARRRKVVFQLREQIIQALQSSMDDNVLKEWLSEMKKQFIIDMSNNSI